MAGNISSASDFTGKSGCVGDVADTGAGAGDVVQVPILLLVLMLVMFLALVMLLTIGAGNIASASDFTGCIDDVPDTTAGAIATVGVGCWCWCR